MKFNKVLEFLILLFAVIITRLGDQIGTYHYTPTLSAEANPMVRLFGFGWTYLIIIQIFGTAFSAWLNYISLFLIKPVDILVKSLSFEDFVSYLYYQKLVKLNWILILTRNPQLKNEGWYMYGWIVPRILIYVGIVLLIFHLLLAFVPGYTSIHKFFIAPMYIMMFSSIPVCVYSYLKFRYIKYKKINF